MSADQELTIHHEPNADGGGFYLRTAEGLKLGEMTYTARGEKLAFDHTWVDDSLRGQGRARQLLNTAMTWVRSEGKKVIPVCPYVVKQFEKDESLHDLL